MPVRVLTLPSAKEPTCNHGSPEHNEGTDEEHGAKTDAARDKPERGAGNPKSEVQAGRVSAHGDAPALGRRAADRLHAQAREDERIAEARERSADRSCS